MKKKIYIGIITLGFLLSGSARPILAQTISLSLWPPLLEVQMMPGKTVVQEYRLANKSDSFLEVTPLIFPFETDGLNGQIKINFKYSANTDPSPYFFSFAGGEEFNKSFPLAPQKEKLLKLKISLPKGEPEKDYYFTLLFSTSSAEKSNKNITASVSQIGTNILLTASSIEKPTLLGRISEFSAPLIIDSFSPVNIKVVLENIGRTYWKPFGKINITGLLKQKDEIKLLEQNVLANSQRQLLISPYKPSLPIGPFRAQLEFFLNQGENQPFLSAETTFWYFPWKLFSGLTAISAVCLTLKKLKKKCRKSVNSPPLFEAKRDIDKCLRNIL